MDSFVEKENHLKQCIEENKSKEAIRILLDQIAAHARNKDFEKAEALRDRLYDIDAMALSEIIRANELIAREKNRRTDGFHKEIWSKLYSILTTDEGDSLYSAFEGITVYPDEMVFKQGEPCSSLYLINQGKLRVTSKRGPREILIYRLGPGNLFGSETFFSNSLCTTSVTALSTSKLLKLDRSALLRWRSHFPRIEPKLKEFCRKEDTISNRLEKNGMDRRSGVRKKLTGKAAIQFLGNSEELIGKPFRGELYDISSGGLSFLFKISDNEKARLMLGRRLILQLRSTASEEPFKIQKKGTVVAIHPRPFNDHSFHIRFDSDLSGSVFKKIVTAFSHQDLGLDKNR